jgi:ribokinase
VARSLVCLGDVMVDIVATLRDALARGSDTHAPISYLGGGSAANTACWLGSLGVPVTFVGRVGADAAGVDARAKLAAAGVINRIQLDPDRATGTCIVLVDPDGERTMIPDPGANAALVASEIDPAWFEPSQHLHVSGYALLGGSRDAARVALTLARVAGSKISIDAASAAPLAAVGADEFLRWIGTDVLLFANAAEAAVLTGESDPADAARLLGGQLGQAVVKAGAIGAFWSNGDRLLHSPAHLITAVDTTGAGDAFAAAYLAATREGDPAANPIAALDAANALAAKACTQIGGRPIS